METSNADPTNVLQRLTDLLSLRATDALAHRCLQAITHGDAIVELSQHPYKLKEVRDIYRKRAAIARFRNHPIEGYDTLIPALEETADNIFIHAVTLPEEWFLVFTDSAMTHLLGILAERFDRLFRFLEEHPEYR